MLKMNSLKHIRKAKCSIQRIYLHISFKIQTYYTVQLNGVIPPFALKMTSIICFWIEYKRNTEMKQEKTILFVVWGGSGSRQTFLPLVQGTLPIISAFGVLIRSCDGQMSAYLREEPSVAGISLCTQINTVHISLRQIKSYGANIDLK